MTTLSEDLHDTHPGRQRLYLLLAVLATVPGLITRFADPGLPHPAQALIWGAAIVGAAFLLSWAAEVAQLDISAGLAIAVLALIAVLPEYAVDFVFAWKGGTAVEAYGAACQAPGATGESACSLALANMTGANRLLIGIGWSSVVFVAAWRMRKVRAGRVADHKVTPSTGAAHDGIQLERAHSVELAFLTAATIYSLFLPFKHSITLVDAAVLVSLFVLYTIRISRAPAEEPHLVGPARYVGGFSVTGRRVTYIGMFVFAAAVILLCAELFAEALVATGEDLGISEFLLVQWLAPLASEAPELLVALLYAWRLNTDSALGTLVSSKVNQWTLLVGTLPIVFAIASGFSATGLPIEDLQREELFLTAAQSFFAVAVLSNLSISVKEAGFLFGLFWAQFILGGILPEGARELERVLVGIVYVILGLVIVVRDWKRIPALLRDGFRTPYAKLAAGDEIPGE